MSRLRERLQRLRKDQPIVRDTNSSSPLVQDEQIAAEQKGEGTEALHAQKTMTWDLPGTIWCENELGRFIKKVRTYPVDYRHGRYTLKELVGIADLHLLAAGDTDTELSRLNVEDLLFLDTETTGLGSGTGNVPFMIGIGWLEETSFQVEQLFIRNPAEEAAMLYDLQDKLTRCRALVTYNGRSFDWPLIKNRYVLHRMKLEEPPAHIDLLYPARRLWQNTLPSCRLGEVEAFQLAFKRKNDIPGSMAPTLYFQFLQDHNPAGIAEIFQHNEWDILTLAGLTVHFGHLLNGAIPFQSLSFEQLYAYGTWLEKLGYANRAEEVMHYIYENKRRIHSPNTLNELAAWCKKRQYWDQAVTLWKQTCSNEAAAEGHRALEPNRLIQVDTFIELAKYYEHRSRNIEEALKYALQARHQVQLRLSWSRRHSKYVKLAAEIDYRIRRLQRKLRHSSDAEAMSFHFD